LFLMVSIRIATFSATVNVGMTSSSCGGCMLINLRFN
jgi:hypothetical protein